MGMPAWLTPLLLTELAPPALLVLQRPCMHVMTDSSLLAVENIFDACLVTCFCVADCTVASPNTCSLPVQQLCSHHDEL